MYEILCECMSLSGWQVVKIQWGGLHYEYYRFVMGLYLSEGNAIVNFSVQSKPRLCASFGLTTNTPLPYHFLI